MGIKSVKVEPKFIEGDLPPDTVKRGGGVEAQYEPALEALKKRKGEWAILRTFGKRNSAKGRANALGKVHKGFEFTVRTVDAETHYLYARAK